jgi:trimeric autotransporter adhesin
MAKVNVNKASREELVEVAGLRPVVAEAVLKARDEHHGRIPNVDALRESLREVRGVGSATLDQLADALSFGAAATHEAAEKTAEVAHTAARNGADAAKAGAEVARQTTDVARQATEKTAEVAQATARQTTEAVRQGAEKTAEVTSIMARSGVEAAQRVADRVAQTEQAVAARSGEAVTDLSQLVVHLMNEQLQANVETLQALARARTWREAVEVQNDFFRANVERATEGASRYVEALTRLMTSMVHVGQEQVKKAA